jgi:hypothetical protein
MCSIGKYELALLSQSFQFVFLLFSVRQAVDSVPILDRGN